MPKKRDLEYYLGLAYPITLYPVAAGGYVAEIRDLPGCLSQGGTPAEAVEMIEDAKRGWIEHALDEGTIVPEPADASYSGRFVVRLPQSLHRQLAEAAEREGASLNQYVLALLAGGVGFRASSRPRRTTSRRRSYNMTAAR